MRRVGASPRPGAGRTHGAARGIHTPRLHERTHRSLQGRGGDAADRGQRPGGRAGFSAAAGGRRIRLRQSSIRRAHRIAGADRGVQRLSGRDRGGGCGGQGGRGVEKHHSGHTLPLRRAARPAASRGREHRAGRAAQCGQVLADERAVEPGAGHRDGHSRHHPGRIDRARDDRRRAGGAIRHGRTAGHQRSHRKNRRGSGHSRHGNGGRAADRGGRRGAPVPGGRGADSRRGRAGDHLSEQDRPSPYGDPIGHRSHDGRHDH